MNDTRELTAELIRCRSVTPLDSGCQEVMAACLRPLGFEIEHLRYGEVDNLWASRGEGQPLFAFAGHTDVVPAGPLQAWASDPFIPDVRNGTMFGRGAADMKGSLAAMMTATERFLDRHPDHRGSIGFLITSDEEGLAVDGTARVIKELTQRDIHIDMCLVGEPSSAQTLGDRIRNGRRGSLNGTLTVTGEQGHVAYPEGARNPIHMLAAALAELCSRNWDDGNEFYPRTSFQVSNINAGTGAENVIPGELKMLFNFRYSTESSASGLKESVARVLNEHGIEYALEWHLSGEPFLTTGGVLMDATVRAIEELANLSPEISTGGGTSDGRFIAPTGTQVIELGPLNATIHKVNECVSLDDLDRLSAIYERILELTLT